MLGEELYKLNEPYIKKVLAGEKVSFERSLKHKDGSYRHTLASYIPNFSNNEVVSFLAIVVDITDLKKLEARLTESAKLFALGEMAAGVAHEINNPLTIIKAQSESAIRKLNSQNYENLTKDFSIIIRTVERIAKIVNGLKAYARNAENDEMETVDLYSILHDSLELSHNKFSDANIEVQIQCELSLKLHCRPAQISQVIINLLNNSFDAVSNLDSKWIEIKSEKKDGHIYLKITDSGLGIPKEVAAKMLNPFFTTKDVGKGTGLGLSISNGLIESNGGKLKYCEDELNTTGCSSLLISILSLIKQKLMEV